jgi:hypothetical protein
MVPDIIWLYDLKIREEAVFDLAKGLAQKNRQSELSGSVQEVWTFL